MSKEIRKAGLWGIVIWAICMGSIASGGASFIYEPISGVIESASFSVDFASFTAHRTVMGYELNYIKLVDLTGNLGTYDLSDDFFGTAAWPNKPKIDMGKLQTGIISADIDSSFFPALAGGYIGLNFCFTDTRDSMFAMDYISLAIETASKTITSYYGWPIGNENNGFGIGLADGADLPAPLGISIPIGATGTGFDETIASDKKVPPPIPVPASLSLTLLGLGAAWLYKNINRRRHTSSVIWTVLVVTVFAAQGASAITITDVKIYQMDFGELTGEPIVDSNCGDFEFTLIPDDDPNIYFLNLTVRLDTNSPSFWVIQNMMTPIGRNLSKPFTSGYSFSLADVVEQGTALPEIEYRLDLSTVPITSAPESSIFTRASVQNGLYNVGSGIENIVEGETGGTGDSPNIKFNGGNDSNAVETRDDVPDLEEELNACTPMSIARSLLWLDKRSFINLGNQKDPNLLKQTYDTAAHRGPNEPAQDVCDILNGKLRVTRDFNIINKFAGPNDYNDFNSPDGKINYRGKASWEFIRNEIDANEDVELVYQDAMLGGKHMVTVIGYSHGPDSNQVCVQDDPNQGQPDPCNQRRWGVYTRYGQLVFGWRRVNVLYILSESPEPRIENIHTYPPDGMYSPDVAVGASASIKAAVQNNFAGVGGADVEFIKRAGSFKFTSGFILSEGSKTVQTTDENGFSEITITGQEPGPALIEVTVTGVENMSAFLFFNIIPCPLSANQDNDCDVDFGDYAIFANQWPEEDLTKLGEFCAQWLEGK